MRRFMTILFSLALVAVLGSAQDYQHVTIREVQALPDSILNAPVPNTDSPHLGDTLWVRGVVATAPRLVDGSALWYTGDRWRLVLKDPTETEFNHITVVASDTAYFNTVGIDQLFVGDSVEILGVITEYRTLTQLEVLRADTVLKLHGVSTHVPVPETRPLADFSNGTASIFNPAEKLESAFIRFENLTVISINGAEFTVADAQGNVIIVDDQSNVIYTNPAAPPLYSSIDWVQGYMFTNGLLNWTISPRDTNDYHIGPVTRPIFEDTQYSPERPGSTDAITISSKVYDTDGTISWVELHYSVNDVVQPTVSMVAGANSIWSATIPALGVDSAVIRYYLLAQDNDTKLTSDPSDTTRARGFFFVLNRDPRIFEIQYNPYGGASSYLGDTVTVTGVATADRRDFGQVVIQDGAGKWRGIIVLSSADSVVRRGDNVTVTGVVEENFSLTILNDATITVNSSGNTLPTPSFVFTGGVRTGAADAESYESVLIQVANVYIVDTNPDRVSNSNFGEFSVSEVITDPAGLRIKLSSTSSSSQDRSNIQFTNRDAVGKIPVYQRDRFGTIKGILNFAFSQFKVLPRDSMDFLGYQNIFTSVEPLDGSVPGEYRLSQNYPNPFNPSTVIEYAIGRQEHVVLNVYNMLGQLVGTAVNGIQPAGSYKVTLGADFFANLSTGMYVYKIQAGDFAATKKFLLIR